MLGNFACFFVACGFFFKLSFSKKKSFRNTIRQKNSLDPDQAWCFFWPDLGPNCLQGYQQTTRIASSRERVNDYISLCVQRPLWLTFRNLDTFVSQRWLCVAKVLCILSHWGVQLILAYSWARPAILVAGKGRGEMFLFLLFLHCHSCSFFFPVPLFHLHYYLFDHFSPFLWEMTQNDPQGLTCS